MEAATKFDWVKWAETDRAQFVKELWNVGNDLKPQKKQDKVKDKKDLQTAMVKAMPVL